mmetsp:Transcript_24544/g.53631  ORF Transcript_24544/g.53631 Transcript_24544/m.53631 type:complete len:98 (+) Transcript_24544:200-493(+)
MPYCIWHAAGCIAWRTLKHAHTTSSHPTEGNTRPLHIADTKVADLHFVTINKRPAEAGPGAHPVTCNQPLKYIAALNSGQSNLLHTRGISIPSQTMI